MAIGIGLSVGLKAKGLFNKLKKYFQYLTLKGSDIVPLTSGYGFLNKGTGLIDSPILNTQIATVDLATEFQGDYNILAGATITDFIGTATLYIDHDKLKVSIAGTCEDLEITTSEGAICKYHFQAGDGIYIYDANGITTDLVVILDIFSELPVISEFVDLSGYNNNIGLKSQVLTFNGTSQLIKLNIQLISLSNTFELEHEFITGSDVVSSQTLVGESYAKNQSYYISSGKFGMRFNPASADLAFVSDTILPNTRYVLKTIYNGSSLVHYINDVEVYNVAASGALANSGAKFATGAYTNGSVAGNYFKGKNIRTRVVTNGTEKLHWIYNQYGHNSIIDLSATGNNGIFVTYADTMWDNKENLPINYVYILGATVYKNDTNSKTMAICKDTSQTITGWTKQGYKEAGVGIYKGVPELFTIPVNAELNELIPSGDYTWEQIDDLVESENIIKTKVSNLITNLVAKKKLTGELFIGGILSLDAILGLNKKLGL